MAESTAELAWFQEQGYLGARPLGGGIWIAITRMLFTWRVMLCDTSNVYEFYCYTDLEDAMDAYDRWDGGPVNPVPGWTRHHA